MTLHPVDRLSARLDGELDAAERADVDRHLAACAACRAVLADLDELRLSARAWQTAASEPARDLWPAIAARLTPRESASVSADVAAPGGGAASTARILPWYQRRWSVGVPELALAASVLAAVAGAALWRGAPPQVEPPAGPLPIVAELESFANDAVITPVSFADAQYDAAVSDLEKVLLQQRDRLDPRTVVVLERNLRIIDDAIREARQALAADPANALLNAHLAGARQRKLDLLRRAALITEGD